MAREWFERLLHPRCAELREARRDVTIKRHAAKAMLRELDARLNERDENVQAILNGFFPKDEGH